MARGGHALCPRAESLESTLIVATPSPQHRLSTLSLGAWMVILSSSWDVWTSNASSSGVWMVIPQGKPGPPMQSPPMQAPPGIL